MTFVDPHRREPRPPQQRRALLPSLGISNGSPRLRGRPKATVILAAMLSLAVAGCGASSRPTLRRTHAPATTATTTSAPLPVTGGRSVSVGALRATLSGANHTPTVNQPWPYSIKVTNATGQPLSGTVAIEFLFGGQIVARDKPPTHPITNGLWQSTLELPTASVGYPLTLRAIAHTPAGSITLNWPITVQR
ncbi:MAG: hypothetical protein ACLP0J_15750 [Solirubrobacteraceae bacterium]